MCQPLYVTVTTFNMKTKWNLLQKISNHIQSWTYIMDFLDT